MIEELHRLSPFDPEHLPQRSVDRGVSARIRPAAVACFDTAFHRDMPRVADCCRSRGATKRKESALRLPRLSYAFLMEELARLGDPAAATGRVILAHLGNGASLAAVRDGKSIDTSMGFTPTAGW